MLDPLSSKKKKITWYFWYCSLLILYGFNKKIFSSKKTFIDIAGFSNSVKQVKLWNKEFAIALNRKQRILISLKHYKIERFKKGLPSRGQRTHTNASTSRLLNSARIKNFE